MGLLNIFKKKSNIDLNTETISGSDSSNMDVSQITNLDGEKEKTKIEEDKTIVVEEKHDEPKKEYILPSSSLLKTYKRNTTLETEAKNNISNIESIISSFGISAKIIEVNIGPRFTSYELELSEGTKYNSVASLHKEIALALITDKVTINPSKKNKNTVSILVSNRELNNVYLKDVMRTIDSHNNNDKLMIALGKDMNSTDIVADLRQMPNLLICGSTGSGKSTCISSLVVSLLLQKKPDELKFAIIDTKKIDFSNYNGLPHLLCPIITDSKQGTIALKNLSYEVERRNELLEYTKTKSITEYNNFCNNNTNYTKLPFIVIIINELSDLELTSSSELEYSVSMIAQSARKVGVHLIICTQLPSSNIITSTIKNNIPARIALSVPSGMASRVILDENGAENLSGNGDMLVKIKKGEPAINIQGCYVSDEEVEKIINYCIASSDKAIYDEYLTKDKTEIINATTDSSYDEYDDPIYNEVAEFAIQAGKISTSLIQRRFKLGYNRSARIIDLLEERGIIGPPDGSKPREVIVKKS